MDIAIRSTLAGDSTLTATLTDGVFFDVAPSGAQNFCIVSQMAHEDSYSLNGNGFEQFRYLVKAVMAGTSAATVKTMAARIHTLLQDVRLTITGYSHQRTTRSERVRYTEVDQANQDARWQHQGGIYDVWVSPT